MPDTFREIEQSHEAKYKLDEELRFKVQCRGNRLLGQWAADRMGLVGSSADGYARDLVRFNLDTPGREQVIGKVVGDFDRRGVRMAEKDVIAACERSYAAALAQIVSDYPAPLDCDHVQIGG